MSNPDSDFEDLCDALRRIIKAYPRRNLEEHIDRAKAVLKNVEKNEVFDQERAERDTDTYNCERIGDPSKFN